MSRADPFPPLRCCVITGYRGAARFKEDIFIESEFKFKDKIENISAIKLKIQNIFKNFEYEVNKFEPYVKKILNEKNIFVQQVKRIFTNAHKS